MLHMHQRADEADINVLYEAIDLDGDGEVSFLEFVAATVDPREVRTHISFPILFL